MARLKVFKNQYMSELEDNVERNINRYIDVDEEFFVGDDSNLLTSSYKLPDIKPSLEPDRQSDADNAIRIFEYLNIDNTAASDPRLWSYLAHTQFCNYAINRWDIGSVDDVNKIKQRFFLGGGARGLHRHAIAKLWWSAKITVAPWETDANLIPLKKDDKFYYTRVLMQDESLASDIVERPQLSASPILLISILEFFDRHPELRYREFYREFLREVILTLGYRKILTVGLDNILAELNEIAFDILRRSGNSYM